MLNIDQIKENLKEKADHDGEVMVLTPESAASVDTDAVLEELKDAGLEGRVSGNGWVWAKRASDPYDSLSDKAKKLLCEKSFNPWSFVYGLTITQVQNFLYNLVHETIKGDRNSVSSMKALIGYGVVAELKDYIAATKRP